MSPSAIKKETAKREEYSVIIQFYPFTPTALQKRCTLASATLQASAKSVIDIKIKEIIRIQGGPDVGSVRAPLAELIEEDKLIAQECAKMIEEAVKKY